MSNIPTSAENIWRDPYTTGQQVPFHRYLHVPWNHTPSIWSISSNGFEFYAMQSLHRQAYLHGGIHYLELRAETLINLAKASMAAAVIARTFRKYRNAKLQRRVNLLTFALRQKVIDDHACLLPSLLGLGHCDVNERGIGLKALRRSAQRTPYPYLQALSSTLQPVVPAVALMGYWCNPIWARSTLCKVCHDYYYPDRLHENP